MAKIVRRALVRAFRFFNPSHYCDPGYVEKKEYIFYVNFLKDKMTVFDIGANIGELSLLFSKFISPNGVLHCFEPTPQTFDKLKSTVTLANRANVILNNIAVSNEIGEITFNVYDDKHSTFNTIANRPLEKYGIQDVHSKKTTVMATTIDNYCGKNKIDQIDLLKIDVEGAEYQVLLGGKKMFLEKRIKCCIFEFGQTIYDMGNKPQDLIRFFDEVGYTLRNIVKNAPLFPHDRNKIALFSMLHAMPQ